MSENTSLLVHGPTETIIDDRFLDDFKRSSLYI